MQRRHFETASHAGDGPLAGAGEEVIVSLPVSLSLLEDGGWVQVQVGGQQSRLGVLQPDGEWGQLH